jgi:hypothetical protein
MILFSASTLRREIRESKHGPERRDEAAIDLGAGAGLVEDMLAGRLFLPRDASAASWQAPPTAFHPRCLPQTLSRHGNRDHHAL